MGHVMEVVDNCRCPERDVIHTVPILLKIEYPTPYLEFLKIEY